MKYAIDNDMHIHSTLSSCSNDPEQSPDRILAYAKACGLTTVCLTDHFWDETVTGASGWYQPQNFEHIRAALPLPEAEGVRFLFGCETDLDKNHTLGISQERFDSFDFVVIPTTHLHMKGFTITPEDSQVNERVAKLWVERLDALLSMPLPFHKIGIAHLACTLINRKSREDYLDTLRRIPREDMERLFTKAAALGVGIELNASDMSFSDEESETVLQMFRIAKACGCKFYLASDAHHPAELEKSIAIFARALALLDLTEDDKFIPG